MKRLIIFAVFAGLISPGSARAIDLKESKFTQIINRVEVISSADGSLHHPAVNALFKMPDVLRTGPTSRAELVAADNTVTRVGANTVFSYDKENRTLDLQQGCLLFHSPHGKGGGAIHTAAVTASVLGTTLIVSVAPDGTVKVLDLEGQVEVRLKDGSHHILESGQMVLVPAEGRPPAIAAFNLGDLVKSSLLVDGFKQPLPSLPLINNQVAIQIQRIASGPLNNAASLATVATTTAAGTLTGGSILTTGIPSPPTLPQNILPTEILRTIGLPGK